MRIYFLIISVLVFNYTFGQKTYNFDYMLEYDYKIVNDSKIVKQIILSNSKDNSYTLTIGSKDSLYFDLFFLDQNGNRSRTHVLKYDFLKSDAIRIPCRFNEPFKNDFKYQTKNYSFKLDSDTLINGEFYYKFHIKRDDLKRSLNKKLYSYHYIIKKGTDFHLPLLTHMTPYEEWKLEKNIPNGIPFMIYYKNHKGEIDSFFQLKKVSQITKAIYVPNECDFSFK